MTGRVTFHTLSSNVLTASFFRLTLCLLCSTPLRIFLGSFAKLLNFILLFTGGWLSGFFGVFDLDELGRLRGLRSLVLVVQRAYQNVTIHDALGDYLCLLEGDVCEPAGISGGNHLVDAVPERIHGFVLFLHVTIINGLSHAAKHAVRASRALLESFEYPFDAKTPRELRRGLASVRKRTVSK